MSDFLGNLIARATHRTPVLERRPHAIFEPADPAIGSFPQFEDRAVVRPERTPAQPMITGIPRERPESENTHIEARASIFVERFDSTSSRVAPPVRNDEASSIPVEALPRAARSAMLPTRTSVEDATPRPLARDRGAVAVASTSPAGSDAVEKERESSRAMLTPPSNKATLRPRVAAPVADPSHAEAVQSPNRRGSLAATRKIATRDSRDEGSTRSKRASPAIAQAVYLAAANRATRQNESGMPAASVPAVYVTIGRVEVRATVPGERARRREEPATPRMTLDDYLRKRSGSIR